MRHAKKVCPGFTLVELIIVLIVIGVASMIAVPMLSSAADMQVRAAANKITADLEYAKSMAMTHQKSYSVVFNPTNASYDIRETTTDTIIANPIQPTKDYAVNFKNDGNVSRVNIISSNFDSDVSNAITFNYLGSPFSGKGVTAPMTAGLITLRADNFTLYVKIESVTGYVEIRETP